MQKVVPLWVVASIGKQVMIAKEFEGACEVFPALSVGTLAGIMLDDADHDHVYCIVALDPKDPTYLENFDFDEIMPGCGPARFSLDLEEGLLSY